MSDARTEDNEEQEALSSLHDDEGPVWRRRRQRPLVRRVGGRVGGHVETRFSYGVLTLSTFGFAAAALLVVIAAVGTLVYLAQGRFVHALMFFIVSLACAAGAGIVGFGAGFVGLPFAGDWFLEWPSHVIAWALGLAGCALLAALIFLTPLPPYVGALLTMAAVFAAGYTIAYTLRVTSPPGGKGHTQRQANRTSGRAGSARRKR